MSSDVGHLPVIEKRVDIVSAAECENEENAMKAQTAIITYGVGLLMAGIAMASGAHAVEGARDLSAYMKPSGVQSPGASAARITVMPTRGHVLEPGDTTRFKIRVNRTGYAHLYVMSASGRIQLWMENVRVTAGKTLTYPIDPMVKIRATAPLGKDRIVAVLTKHKVDGFGGYQTTVRPMEVGMEAEEFQNELKAILGNGHKTPWAWARTIVNVTE